MSSAVKDLLDILDLEPLDLNLFRGRQPQAHWQRVFGGQVIGQALVAAVRTVDAARPPHSLHAYFLLPGDPKIPIIYDVDRIRDGKSFTTRRVTARQHGHPIFSAHGFVPCRRTRPRASGQDAQGAAAGGPAGRVGNAQGHAADHARCGAPLLRARAADRNAPGGVRALYRQESRRRPLPHVDPHHRRLPDDPPSINACSPMPPT